MPLTVVDENPEQSRDREGAVLEFLTRFRTASVSEWGAAPSVTLDGAGIGEIARRIQ